MVDAALVFAIVFAVNLLPAFGPPTWTVLIALRLGLDVPAVPLVAAGALGAATGRWTLAHGAWRLRGRLPDERPASLEALTKLDWRRLLARRRPAAGAATPAPS